MSIQLALLKKVRCRFLCTDSGGPVAGIVASLAIGMGEASNRIRVPLGTLCSDATGYVSFDLKGLISRGVTTADQLILTSPQLPNGEVNLLDALFGGKSDSGDAPLSLRVSAISMVGLGAADTNGDGGAAAPNLCLVFPVQVPRKPCPGDQPGESPCSRSTLPAIQSPDACDYQASPFSFVTPVASSLGDGCCETMVPATLPIQEHRFFKVIVRREANEGDLGLVENLGNIREVSVTDALITHSPKLKFAEVLEFQQQWLSLGHSLGEIKYSLALAPGEATQIAVIDWSRQDSISRTDSVLSGEYMDHSIKRDRSIEETIDSALKESQGGSSFMAGTSGQATIPLTYVTMSFNHAIGYGVSNSWGNRDLEANSLQDLHDKIRQQSGYTRSLNSTVVVQASQAEQNVLQTRKVANHNHCHALTIQYYEVLRHYKIRTLFTGRRKALLVPFKPFPFTWELALQFRSILEPVLIDPALKPCFDAIYRLKAAPSVYDTPQGDGGTGKPPAPTPPPAPAPLTKKVTVFTYYPSGVGSQVEVKQDDKIRISATGEALTGGFVAFGPDGHADTATADFMAPGLRKFSLICKVGRQGTWQQAGAFAEVVADGDGELIFNMNDVKNDYDNNRPLDHSEQKDRWEVSITYPSHATVTPDPGPPADPNANPNGSGAAAPAHAPSLVEDSLCLTKLLTHLNGNLGYYDGCVWALQNPIERRIRLEAALSEHPDLLDALDDIPLAISGNYVAFAYDGPFLNWEPSRATDPALPLEDIVTLPTRGVFAEAQLGHCNACEERDPTRMWDWKEMTIETPPDIGGITPGPKGQAASVTPSQLPGNVIQISQPPSAPDPTGLAAALKVLGTPDIFRNMSGLDEVSKLLETLSKESSEANIKAMALQAKEKLDNAKGGSGGAGAGGSSSGGGSGSSREPASEPDAAKQVDRLKALEYGKSKGLISDEAASNAAEGVVGGGPGGILGALQQMILGAVPVVKRAQVTFSNPGRRPCCALGQWKLGASGALDPTRLGGHRHGSGLALGGPTGYVYTKTSGLIDLGHIRDMADMTLFIYEAFLTGATLLELYEGTASVFALPADPASALDLAGAIAFVESWAHELTTWPDESSFSPEDLCSNIIGVECAKRAIRAGGSFDAAMDTILDSLVNGDLKAVPMADTDSVLTKIDGDWFNATRLPPSLTLLRRNFDGTPWPAGMPFDAPISFAWLNPASFEPLYSEFTYKIRDAVDGKLGVALVSMKAETAAIRAKFILANPGKDTY